MKHIILDCFMNYMVVEIDVWMDCS